MKKRRHHPVRNFLVGLFVFGAGCVLLGGGVFLLWASSLTMPTLESIEAQQQAQSTKIYDRTGTVLLYDMHQDVRRTVIPLADMSDYVKHATIAIEDSNFYHHFGIEPLSILRAILHNIQHGDLFSGEGGSTLTQQVVKNTLLSQEKTVTRKLKEWILAIKLERIMTKDQILELYLNETPYGGTRYGVEEASEGFFGKHAKDLTIAESAYIAALPQAPTYYSPYGNHKDALEARKNLVLEKMHEQNYITDDQYKEALAEKVAFLPPTGATIKAPHFVFYVLDQLSKKYGDAELAQMNLKVITTLDWNLQREAESIVYKHVMDNVTKYNASNGSLMAVDPKTGEILVMVGSRDYFDDKIDGNYNIGLAMRQPGSSFKPFVYAEALKKGYTTETVLYDVKTQFSTACDKTDLTMNNGCYAPVNYDGKFRGPMTFRNALAQSVNVPAVKAIYLAGVPETVELARSMGVTSLNSDYKRYGLTLALGGGEVSLLDMTSAYGVFANEGMRYSHTAILKVEDGSGKTLEELDPQGERVLDPEIAREITDMLDDNVARTPEFGSDSYLYFPGRDVAVKTGTTNDFRDAWTIGYTPTIAVGAWAGNNDNSPMDKKIAGFIIAPLWNDFMQTYFAQHPDHTTFTRPQPIDTSLKPVLRGYAPAVTTDSTSTASGPLPHSILQYVNKDDPRGPYPSNPASDPQYAAWEYGILLWRLGHGSASAADVANMMGTSTAVNGDTNNGTTPATTVPIVTILSPDEHEHVRQSDTVRVALNVQDQGSRATKTDYYVDGTLLGSSNDPLEHFLFVPKEHDIASGDHTLMVIVYNEAGGRGGASVDFSVH